MNRWPKAPLSELAANEPYACVGGPFGSELTTRDYVDRPGVPVIRGSNLSEDGFLDDGFVFVSERKAETLRANQARPGDIVFTQRGTIGQIAIIPHQARHECYVLSQSQMKLTPDLSRLEPRFLLHYFRSPAALGFLMQNTLATGVPHINLSILRRAPVPMPPLSEQRRIAEILDKAETLRAKRRAAVSRLDTLKQSIFLDMFGDPATNPKGWPKRAIGELLDSASYGTSEKAGEAGEFPVLRMNNITRAGEIDLSDLKYMNLEKSHRDRFLVRTGDVLFNRTNSAELVGKTAIYRHPKPMAYAGYLIRLRVDTDNDAEYLAAFLNTPYAKRVLRGMCKSIIGMANINATEVQSIAIAQPPLEVQRRFAQRARAVGAVKQSHHRLLTECDSLFAALQHWAFRGEL